MPERRFRVDQRRPRFGGGHPTDPGYQRLVKVVIPRAQWHDADMVNVFL
ncbi:hypothetical protein RR42_s2763 [Cupriavidus basilensis]|uniref:Uncharacterized protein n=1 Tax=Cupriavidus basilensis TaxID=68895 RepID=A0A0C4YQQ4_9BURK|nr:hypothetical protein RR42_s2763 [Cupriavidus basilensis]